MHFFVLELCLFMVKIMNLVKQLVNESKLLKTLQNKLLVLNSEINNLYKVYGETELSEEKRFAAEQKVIHFFETDLEFEITRHIEDVKNICLKKTSTINNKPLNINVSFDFYHIDIVTINYENIYYLFSNSVVRQLFTFDKSDLTKIDLLFIFNNNELLTVLNDSVLKNENIFNSGHLIINKIIDFKDKELFNILYNFFIEKQEINTDAKDMVNIKYDLNLEHEGLKEINELIINYKQLLNMLEDNL